MIHVNKKRKIEKNKILVNCCKLYSAIKIQNAYKKYINFVRKSDVLHTKYIKNEKFINESTFMGLTIITLEKKYLYKHSCHFFDIRELIEHLKNSNRHPYTNILFSKFSIQQIYRINYNLKKSTNFKTLSDDYNENVSYKNIISSLKTDLSIQLDRNCTISNISILNNYDEADLYLIIEELTFYSLIRNIININYELKVIDRLYRNLLIEKKRLYQNGITDYFSNMYKCRFEYLHKIYKLLNFIVNYNDDNKTIRCHIVNQIINNN